MSRTILVCESAEHAESVDQLVAASLREEDGTCCNGWSGVLTDGERFGILWAEPVSSLFGVPEDFPELELIEEADDKPWATFVPPPPDPEPAP